MKKEITTEDFLKDLEINPNRKIGNLTITEILDVFRTSTAYHKMYSRDDLLKLRSLKDAFFASCDSRNEEILCESYQQSWDEWRKDN